MTEIIPPTEKTKLGRIPKRGSFDRTTIYKILDEAFICHVGFVVDGQPFVIPTGYARVGDRLLIHGSAASRMLRALTEGIDVCVTVTLLDGLVLARSAFHHSMNYRSVVVFGRAQVVSGEHEKLDALRAFTEHIIRGRWADVRLPTPNELKATWVLSLPLEEASAKIRTGAPVDDESDYALKVWAGEIPLRLKADTPIPDSRLPAGIELPAHVADYSRRNAK
ncbi:MAG TPA: pyridoxamine 5'-phosphate oxidase family protein [Pyrinomonadaceae bacterium]|nr:pyridoxamine 5'-phosphate oxidase family protein [Pyrinomonadaceae bacterium]